MKYIKKNNLDSNSNIETNKLFILEPILKSAYLYHNNNSEYNNNLIIIL